MTHYIDFDEEVRWLWKQVYGSGEPCEPGLSAAFEALSSGASGHEQVHWLCYDGADALTGWLFTYEVPAGANNAEMALQIVCEALGLGDLEGRITKNTIKFTKDERAERYVLGRE